MRRILTTLVRAAPALLLLALFTTAAPAQAQTATATAQRQMVDLGTLAGPHSTSYANAINNRGEVVGQSTLDDVFQVHAFLWRQGEMTDLAPLSTADDINDHGVVVGAGASANGEYHALMWADGKATDLGTLGGTLSQAFGINNLGQVVGLSWTASGEPHGFLWDHGKMTDLAPLVSANDINDQGQVVGEYWAPGGSMNPVMYQPREHKLTDLGTADGWYGEAMAVNNRTQVAGYLGVPRGNTAFYWSNGQMTDLGTLSANDQSQGLGINDRGLMVGEVDTSVGSRAFVWSDGAMTLLPQGGVATDINNSDVIVGSASVGADENHAVLWR
jgi:probable HAF family extracellular repeat protein